MPRKINLGQMLVQGRDRIARLRRIYDRCLEQGHMQQAAQAAGLLQTFEDTQQLALHYFTLVASDPTLSAIKPEDLEGAAGAGAVDVARSARLAAVGLLTSSLVDEISQPLTSIHLNASVALRLQQQGDQAGVSDALEDIIGAGARINGVVTSLRALLRKSAVAFDSVDMNAIIMDVIRLVKAEALHTSVTLETRLAKIPSVMGDDIALRQLLLNLLLNAFDAVSESSKRLVWVETRAPHNVVQVLVQDSGLGLNAQQRKQLFEPFFSTKRDGLGLGLAISKTIAEAHGGRLYALPTSHGAGATFCLELSPQREPFAA